MFARLHLATAQNTADTEAEQRYLTFLSEVQPKVEEAEQQPQTEIAGQRPAAGRFRDAAAQPARRGRTVPRSEPAADCAESQIGPAVQQDRRRAERDVARRGIDLAAAAPDWFVRRSISSRASLAAGLGTLAGRSDRDQRSVAASGAAAPADRAQRRSPRLPIVQLARTAAL